MVKVESHTEQQPVVEKPFEDRKSEPVKVVKTVVEAERLMMNRATAFEGLEMLNGLITEGNYEATFLKSRLLFDPSGNANDKKFYDSNWASMRTNSGLTANNIQAHELLMQAYRIDDADYVMLYQLGCDFMSGKRGCDRNASYARWCFDKAYEVLGVDNGEVAQQYRTEIKSKQVRLKNVKAVKP